MKISYVATAILTLVLLATLLILNSDKVNAENSLAFYANGVEVEGGGDCFADKVTGDTWLVKTCWGNVGNGQGNSDKEISTPVPSVTSTPKPELSPEPNPTKVTSTPAPTENPTEEPTAQPTEDSGKDCKNKNQYKEGTEDCNAGRGNG